MSGVDPARRWPGLAQPKRLAVLGAGVIAVLAAAVLGLLTAVDLGALDGAIQGLATAKAHRPVRFQRLHAHLLSFRPLVEIDGLVIGSPSSVTTKDLLHAARITVHLHLLPLLWGRLDVTDIVVENADLHLVRLGPGKNNYSLGQSSPGSGLRSVRSFSAPNGHVTYEDPARRLSLEAAFDHAAQPGPAALTMRGGGVVNGQPFEVVAEGSALNGRAPNVSYPMHAEMRDGAVALSLRGVTSKPFDFRTLDMSVAAKGPNLADIGYLFNFSTPNSPPFALTGRLVRGDHVSRLLGLKAQVGESDLSGDLIADHSRPQAAITAHIQSRRLNLADIKAMLEKRPDHAVTRAVPGTMALPGSPAPKGRLSVFSMTDLPLERLRKTDVAADLEAAQVLGLGADVKNLALAVRLESGRLVVAPVRADLNPGVATGRTVLDARGASPKFSLRFDLVGARLGQLRPKLKPQIDAAIDVHAAVSGEGRSPHLIASTASGRAAFVLSAGVIPRFKAAALGGDLIQAAALSLSGSREETQINCGVGAFELARGVATAQDLALVTGAGEAHGRGYIDLGREQVDLTLEGRPTSSAAKVFAPVALTGSILQPKATLQAVQGIKKAGLRAAVGAVLSLPAAIVARKTPAPVSPGRCQALIAGARRFVGP